MEKCSERLDVQKEVDNHEDVRNEAFNCDFCEFFSNREKGLKIHMKRKHQPIEQLDGNYEEIDDFETEFDNEIEEFLSTGNMECIDPQFWEDLSFYLEGKEEKLLALETRKQALDKMYGIGFYLTQLPWNLGPDLWASYVK